jgi:hypothetical protein
MRVGYARLGRSMSSNPERWGVVGGDVEPPRLLQTLAERHPEDTFYLLGRTSVENPQEFGQPDNVINPWNDLNESRKRVLSNPERDGGQLSMNAHRKFVQWCDDNIVPLYREMDAVVVWIGQHGSIQSPDIPKVHGAADDIVRAQDWAVLYGAPIIRGINAFREKDPVHREEIWLISDARNYLKTHDLKWPLTKPILGQYAFGRDMWAQRYGDNRDPRETGFGPYVKHRDRGDGTHWRFHSDYIPSTLEICGILPQHTGVQFNDNFSRINHFGLFINEARAASGIQRADVVRDWVRWNSPDWIHGQWTIQGLKAAHVESIVPLPAKWYFPQLQSTRCTFTTPSSGSGWATTKPWEAFGAGTVCFKHPGYDDQEHIYGRFDATARKWLCPATSRDLHERLERLRTDEPAWRYLVHEQYRVFANAVNELKHIRLIEERIWT